MSGRRAAENTNTTPNDARCVWLTEETLELHESGMLTAEDLRHAFESATPDPVGVLAEAEYRGRWPDDQNLKQYGQGSDWRKAARRNLEALGYPDGLRRQDNPTP